MDLQMNQENIGIVVNRENLERIRNIVLEISDENEEEDSIEDTIEDSIENSIEDTIENTII